MRKMHWPNEDMLPACGAKACYNPDPRFLASIAKYGYSPWPLNTDIYGSYRKNKVTCLKCKHIINKERKNEAR